MGTCLKTLPFLFHFEGEENHKTKNDFPTEMWPFIIIQETLRLHYWRMHCRHADALSVYSPNFEIQKLDSHTKKTLNLGYNPYIHGIFTY